MLYTKKGDDGTTTLFSSKTRLSKADIVFEILGSLDELNSYLGLCKSLSKGLLLEKEKVSDILEKVQNDLFTIQAEVAKAPHKISKTRLNWLENKIAKIEEKLPKINSFLIPGGDEVSAHLDIARTLARKAERRAVAIKKDISDNTLAYLNRLSSLLYALARYVNVLLEEKQSSPTYSEE